MRGFLFGFVLLIVLGLSVLSFRPGGLRKQLGFAARRFRIMLVLGGIYVAVSTIIRVAAPQGVVADYGPPALAVVLAALFLVFGRDPVEEGPSRKT